MSKAPKKIDKLTDLPLPSMQDTKDEPNPFTASDWRLFLFAWSGFTLRILLCVGAIFSAMQFLQSRHEKRVERSLDLVTLWESDSFQKAQSAVKRRLGDLNRQSAGLITPQTTPEQLAIIMSSIGNQAMTAEGGEIPLGEFREHFDRVVYFLSRVASCVEGNLCDQSVADEFFLDYARSFWSFFSDWIEKARRQGAPNLAIGIENYLKVPR